jgi:tripartite-type tricarboxylate transporter receptor subunit TctC
MKKRSITTILLLLTILLFTTSNLSFAASFPTKTITIVSPYPPGGGNDIVCRSLIDRSIK